MTEISRPAVKTVGTQGVIEGINTLNTAVDNLSNIGAAVNTKRHRRHKNLWYKLVRAKHHIIHNQQLHQQWRTANNIKVKFP